MDKKVCICTTLWSSINNWILPFLNEYNKRGIDVTIVCNMDNEFEQGLKEHFPFVRTYCIGFPRGINAIGSLKSIWTLYKFFKKEKFDLVQYSTLMPVCMELWLLGWQEFLYVYIASGGWFMSPWME